MKSYFTGQNNYFLGGIKNVQKKEKQKGNGKKGNTVNKKSDRTGIRGNFE